MRKRDSATIHLARAIFLLRRQAHAGSVPYQLSRKAVNLATSLECLTEQIEPIEQLMRDAEEATNG